MVRYSYIQAYRLCPTGSDSQGPTEGPNVSLSHKLWEQLCNINNLNLILKGPPPSGIISFNVDSKMSPAEIVKLLGKESIWIRVLEDPIWLRACVHITSTEEEIEMLSTTLRKLTA